MLTCLISTINSLHYNIAHNKKWHIQIMENPISSEVVKPHTLVQATANDMQACFWPPSRLCSLPETGGPALSGRFLANRNLREPLSHGHSTLHGSKLLVKKHKENLNT